MKTSSRFRLSGFSLIEVLVAIAILSFGLLALASLQISLMRTSADAKIRTVALALAKDQLETMRDYSTLAGYRALTDGNDTPAAPSGSGVTFTRTWTVQRYVFEDDVDNDGIKNEANDQQFQANGTDTGATPAGFVADNEFKVIKVTVAWTDSTGAAQQVAMEDATGALSPSDSALVAKLSSNSTRRNIPTPIFDPSTDAMVIPIALGNGVNSAATNPKPQLVIGLNTVETTFDVLTYAGLNGGLATAQQRVETLVIGCTCDFSTAPATTVRGKRPSYWDGFRYTVPKASTFVVPAGVSASDANNQSTRCDICCRDHHDPVGATGATFSPRLVTFASGAVSVAHPHHLDKNTATPATSGKYKEACRLIRVDGIFRVAADLEDDYFALLRTDNGLSATVADYAPDATTQLGSPTITGGAVKRYQDFVVEYMDTRFRAPPVTATAATLNTVGSPATLAGGTKYDLDDPVSLAMELSDHKWAHSRGLYVDYLENEAVEAIKAAKQDSNCTTDTPTLSICILRLLPFTSINLTELADWDPLDGAGSPLTVTNSDYKNTLNQVEPVRGYLTTVATAAANLTATTKSRKWNSGLLDYTQDGISPNDAVFLTDTQPVAISGGSSGGAGDGTFYVDLMIPNYVNNNAVTATPIINNVDQTGCNRTSTASMIHFICNIDGTASGGIGVGGTMKVRLKYNFQGTRSLTSTISPCTNVAQPTFPQDKSYNPTGQESYNYNTCYNFGINTVTVAPTGSSPSLQAAVGDNTQAETATIDFNGTVAAGDTVTVTFNTPAITDSFLMPGASPNTAQCTYTCVQTQGNDCKNGSGNTVFAVTTQNCP